MLCSHPQLLRGLLNRGWLTGAEVALQARCMLYGLQPHQARIPHPPTHGDNIAGLLGLTH